MIASWQVALASLSAAVAVGGADAVGREAERALDRGASPEAVYEAVLQCYLFVGFPRAIEAFFAVTPVLDAHGFRPPASRAATPGDLTAWTERGESLCRSVYATHYDKLLTTLKRHSPDLAAWMILEGYGKTLSRPGLGPAEREYAVVAILTVTRMWRQLRSHALGAVHVGGTRDGVRDAIRSVDGYADPETIAEALRVTGLEEADARG